MPLAKLRAALAFSAGLGLLAEAAAAATCLNEAMPDWPASTNSSARVRPADCTIVEQTPPDFSWPDHGPGARYEFRLTSPDGATRSRTTEHNWIAWDEALPPGEYRWRVRLLPRTGEIVDGRVRRFVVSSGATPFVVPEWTVLLARASATPRPRALPRDREAFLASLAIDRREGLAHLLGGVNNQLRVPVQPEPVERSKNQYWAEVHNECRHTLNAAFA